MARTKIKSAWVVTHDFSLGESVSELVQKRFPEASVQRFYRTYHVENMVAIGSFHQPPETGHGMKGVIVIPINTEVGRLEKTAGGISPDLIVTTGTCKTRDEYGQSVAVHYPEICDFAERNRIPIVNPTFCDLYSPTLFKLKLFSFGYARRK
jgi:hypothetical protein